MQLNNIAIIFDMDGVLVDVTSSYRQAILLTVRRMLSDSSISVKGVDLVKQVPGLNNDWDATYALIYLLRQNIPYIRWKDTISGLLPIKRDTNEYRKIYQIFQTLYKTLMIAEKRLINPSLLENALQTGFKLGIATGRPKNEALAAVKNMSLTKYFSLDNIVALEDADREKPFPDPLLQVKKKVIANTYIYVGDTSNDRIAARAAKMNFYLIGGQKFPTINVFLNDIIRKYN